MIVPLSVDFSTGALSGDIIESASILGDMQGLYEDEAARQSMPQDTVMYRVQFHSPAPDAPGGLYFGTSFINPGLVGDEYFMTKGHFHSKREAAEYYWCITGRGILLLMSESGETTWQEMVPGTLRYIPGFFAHRLVNTGEDILTVGACWPSDAGHDYETIREKGFGIRVKNVNGVPKAGII